VAFLVGRVLLGLVEIAFEVEVDIVFILISAGTIPGVRHSLHSSLASTRRVIASAGAMVFLCVVVAGLDVERDFVEGVQCMQTSRFSPTSRVARTSRSVMVWVSVVV
jgi:hypothetical protein